MGLIFKRETKLEKVLSESDIVRGEILYNLKNIEIMIKSIKDIENLCDVKRSVDVIDKKVRKAYMGK